MDTPKLSRRQMLRLSLATAGTLALAACAPAQPAPASQPAAEQKPAETKAPEQAAPTAAPSVKEVTVRWMTRAADWGGQPATLAIPKLVEQYFYPKNPGVKVAIEPAPDQWEQKLLTAMVGGESPDVFEAWPAVFNNWVERDLMLDLNPYVDKDLTADDKKDYIVAQWDALFMNGKRIGLPLYVDMRLETYNKDLFDKAGVAYPPADGNWTVDDYAAMAQKLTKDNNGDGQVDQWGTMIEQGGWFYWPRMYGGEVVDPNDNTKCVLDSDAAQEALNFVWDKQWKMKPNVFAQPAQVENSWYFEAVVSQRVAMAEKGCYPGKMVDQIAGKFKWNYAHPPKGPKGRHTLIDADGWSIWKGSKVPDAAWKLVSFNSAPTFQEEVIAKVVGAIPARLSVAEKFLSIAREKFPELKDVRLETLVEILKEPGYGGNVRFFKKDNAAWEVLQPAYDLVFSTGEKDPSYFKEIVQQVNATQA
jgi:multiple sugar transport system substrate-binding protein